MRVVELARLTHCQAASACAHRGCADLMSRVDQIDAPFTWNGPALAAMDGERCVGVVIYRDDENDLSIIVQFAHVEPEHRDKPVLACLLSRLREKFRGQRRAIDFVYHVDNELMQGAVERVGARVMTVFAHYDMPEPIRG